MSLLSLKRCNTLERNISHPRKAAATRTATLSGLGFSVRAELNKCLCNGKKHLCRLTAVSWAFRVTWKGPCSGIKDKRGLS